MRPERIRVLPLGPFDLEAPAALGGMAQLWRARHRAQGTAVAVKVLTGARARRPQFLSWFRTEVRAVAALLHPHIVMVFDHGSIPTETARRSRGRLVAGSPYLAMEWASGETLATAPLPKSWRELSATLSALLDALAHAHARGVVHRDLKAGNVLRCLGGDLRPGLKLADFGIARAHDLSASEPHGGTSAYMAPEQAEGRWRDEGPWTDLYSLGCLAFKLATGTHYVEDPRAEPAIDVPAEFRGWMEALLEPDPGRRFRQAADAAWELWRLDRGRDPDDPSPQAAPPGGNAGPPRERSTSRDEPTLPKPPGRPSWPPQPPSPGGSPRPPRAAPMPGSWRRAAGDPRHDRAVDLTGVGTGLYGLRAVSLVGREEERDRLWAALRWVHDRRSARVVVLAGPSGCGKSRLSEWLCERAMELGAATPLKASHGPRGGSTDGIAPMLGRHLCSTDMTREEVLARVSDVLGAPGRDGVTDPDEALALTELLVPVMDREPPSRRSRRRSPPSARATRTIRFASAEERHEVAFRYLHRLALERPVVLWLDDVQWGFDALAFVLHLLEAQARSPSPLLVLATAGEEVLVERSAESELLSEVLARPEVETLEVGPLPVEHWRSLVRGLLGLEASLAQRVERRAAGNPLFAVQLVGAWVQRGLLVPARNGFRLRRGARIELPDDLRQVWDDRVDRLLQSESDADASALEIAAVLGQDVDAREWAGACQKIGVAVPWDLLETLLDRRLARAGGQGPRVLWSFAHAMLRESLERRAARRGRLARHHLGCARLFAEQSEIGSAERLGRHLLAGGDAQGAIEPLAAGADEHIRRGDLRAALGLLLDRDAALSAIGASPGDPRWAQGWALCAFVETQRGRPDEALGWVRRVQAGARRSSWAPALALALFARARVELMRGHLGESRRICEESRRIFADLGDEAGATRCLAWLGIVTMESGDSRGALSFLRQAYDRSEQAGDEAGAASALYELGNAERRVGGGERARRLFLRAVALCEKIGLRQGAANAMVGLGEVERAKGDFDGAEHAYAKALSIHETIGSANAAVTRLNLGLARLGRGDYPGAAAIFARTQPELEQSGRRGLLGCVHVEQLPCCAALGDWSGWDAHHEAAASLLDHADIVDGDLAWAAALAGDLARAAGQHERARTVYDLAAAQWRSLGRVDQALRVEAASEELRVGRRDLSPGRRGQQKES